MFNGTYVDSTGGIHALPDQPQARIKYLQRRSAHRQKGSCRCRTLAKTIAKHQRKRKSVRNNGIRHIVRDITTLSNLVLLEDLKIEI